MTPQELKGSILNLAFKGALINDENFCSENLYSYIQLKKKELIKKKVKFKKTLEINEDDIPHKLPNNWQWARLCDVFQLIPTGVNEFEGEKEYYSTGSINLPDFKPEGVYNFKNRPSRANREHSVGDLLDAKMQKTLKVFIVNEKLSNSLFSTGFYGLRIIAGNIKYLKYYIESPLFQKMKDSLCSGTTQKAINDESLINILFPLAPLEVQDLIVKKIEELLPIVDRYEEAWNKLEIFNKKFPIDLEKSIIQLAMKGKLTKQLPDEGNGGLLLKEIENKKKILLKEKKIDKDKKITAINYDDLPFEIPQNWAWAKLQTVLDKLVDGDHNPPAGTPFATDYWMLSSTNIGNNKIENLDKKRYLIKEVFEIENERTRAQKGDIFFTSVGTLGRSCIFDGNGNYVFQRSVSVMHTLINNKYLKYYFDSPYFQSMVVRKATGTAQKGFYLNQLADSLVPIPPLREQERIVAKLEELLPLCRKLVK